MRENKVTAKRKVVNEEFLQGQIAIIKGIINKKEEYLIILKSDDDFENRQIAKKTKTEIEELGKALERIKYGTYGFCKDFKNRISVDRLKVMPLATSCITCTKCGANKKKTLF